MAPPSKSSKRNRPAHKLTLINCNSPRAQPSAFCKLGFQNRKYGNLEGRNPSRHLHETAKISIAPRKTNANLAWFATPSAQLLSFASKWRLITIFTIKKTSGGNQTHARNAAGISSSDEELRRGKIASKVAGGSGQKNRALAQRQASRETAQEARAREVVRRGNRRPHGGH